MGKRRNHNPFSRAEEKREREKVEGNVEKVDEVLSVEEEEKVEDEEGKMDEERTV